MSNSNLATYSKTDHNNQTAPRRGKVLLITPHCYVGQVTAQQGCDSFARPGRGASANYVIGYDGAIGLSVPECNRAWTTGGTDTHGNAIRVNGIAGSDNDHEAVTIEVASDKVAPYTITPAAYSSLVRLMADIAARNGIPKLLWKGDKSLVGRPDLQNITVHRWFANKSCPGDYIYNRLGDIATEANRLIAGGAADPAAGSGGGSDSGLYRVRTYWGQGGKQIGAYKVLENAKRAADQNPGFSVYDSSGRKVYPATEFKVLISTDVLRIRTGPGTNYTATGKYTGKGVFTIVQESAGAGSTAGWGKLKSGAGWISLDYVTRV